MNQRLLDVVNQSFLAPLLADGHVTDIAYNGIDMYYMHNLDGRQKSDIVVSLNEVMDFLRQVANLSEQQFSFSHPILDVSIGHYRLNAVHGAIARASYDRVVTFSLRIGQTSMNLIQPDTYFHPAVFSLLQAMIRSKTSIVIAGLTSSGKTELQKFLFQLMDDYTRIIVIDNIQELESIRVTSPLDITCWQKNDMVNDASFSSLIANGLRSNPDWLFVAEARGKEMLDILNAAMTGHPLILTTHSLDLLSLPSRLTRMVLMGDANLRFEEVKKDIEHHFTFYLYLERSIDAFGHIVRHLKEVAEVNQGQVHILYQKERDTIHFGVMSESLQKRVSAYMKPSDLNYFSANKR